MLKGFPGFWTEFGTILAGRHRLPCPNLGQCQLLMRWTAGVQNLCIQRQSLRVQPLGRVEGSLPPSSFLLTPSLSSLPSVQSVLVLQIPATAVQQEPNLARTLSCNSLAEPSLGRMAKVLEPLPDMSVAAAPWARRKSW